MYIIAYKAERLANDSAVIGSGGLESTLLQIKVRIFLAAERSGQKWLPQTQRVAVTLQQV